MRTILTIGRTLMTGITGFTKLTSGSRKSLKSLKSASASASASAMSLSKADAKSVHSMVKSMASGNKNMVSTRSMGPRIDTSGERSGNILDIHRHWGTSICKYGACGI